GNAQGGVMMKAAPAPSLVVAQSEFLLELLIVPFNAPAHFGGLDQIDKWGVSRQRRQPILGRFCLAYRPFDQQPLFCPWSTEPLLVPMRRSHSHRGKARGQFLVGSLTPLYRAPLLRCQRFGQPLYAKRRRARHTLPPCRGTPDFVFGLWRHRPRASRPYGGDRLHPHTILQPHFIERFTPRRFIAIACIRQHDADGNARSFGHADLLQRDLGLGLKLYFLRHTGLFPPPLILSPSLRQVQPPVDRHTATLGGQRPTHRHLTIVLLAQLPAVLPRYSHRVSPFLGKPGIVHDPIKLALAPKLGHHPIAHAPQNRHVGPLRVGHQVVQRLMLCADVPRINVRRQRFHALTLNRQHQSSAVIRKPHVAVLVPQCF